MYMFIWVYACSLAGSPFHINVIDPSKAVARGDGLDMVQCNLMTSFFISAPAAQLKDFDVKIIGKSNDSTVAVAVVVVVVVVVRRL